MPSFNIPAKGIKFQILCGTGRQPWHYRILGGNGEPETSSETFSNARDCVQRIEGHWLGFAIAMGWHADLGMPPPIPFHDDSAGHNLPSACKLGYHFRGITNRPTITARKAVRELMTTKALIPMKVGGLSRKSLDRAVKKSAAKIQEQMKASLVKTSAAYARSGAVTPHGLGSILKANPYISPTQRKKAERMKRQGIDLNTPMQKKAAVALLAGTKAKSYPAKRRAR